MTKKELLEKLKAKAASAKDGAKLADNKEKGTPAAPAKPNAGVAQGGTPTPPPAAKPKESATDESKKPGAKDGEPAPAAPEAGADPVLAALQELSGKLDLIGEALATILEGKAAPADDAADKEADVEQGDEEQVGTSGDEEEDEEEEEEEEHKSEDSAASNEEDEADDEEDGKPVDEMTDEECEKELEEIAIQMEGLNGSKE